MVGGVEGAGTSHRAVAGYRGSVTATSSSARGNRSRRPRSSISPWAPLIWFLGLAVALVVVVAVQARPPGPLDQPDPADQRDGLLLDGPEVAPTVAGVRFGDRPVVLLFLRTPPEDPALQRWAAQLPDSADVRVVLAEPAPRLAVPTVVDRGGVLASTVDMPTPVDGGPPVGYAVVDSGRVVRYATLDPAYLRNAFEVATMAGAVQ